MTAKTLHPLLESADQLTKTLEALAFAPPVTHVYNPLRYARALYAAYLLRYGMGPREFIFLGMNPGPFGMTQTGVPFGEVHMVKDWLRLDAPVDRPSHEHPKRPIEGLACQKSEVSGARIWGLLKRWFGTPEAFFAHAFVANYCPLVFMEVSGRNRTPDKLPKHEREPLFAACDEALRQTMDYFSPRVVVGVGNFAFERACKTLLGSSVVVGKIPHPSPANPAANRGWAEVVHAELTRLGFQGIMRP